jgi:hypothetical protein
MVVSKESQAESYAIAFGVFYFSAFVFPFAHHGHGCVPAAGYIPSRMCCEAFQPKFYILRLSAESHCFFSARQ